MPSEGARFLAQAVSIGVAAYTVSERGDKHAQLESSRRPREERDSENATRWTRSEGDGARICDEI
jgi:hypothetical protein